MLMLGLGPEWVFRAGLRQHLAKVRFGAFALNVRLP